MEWIILIAVLVIIIKIFKSRIKGAIGETVVASRLSGLPMEQYRVINDVMLYTDYGTTQIDHVVVSVYGIFVIETKNYKGWITGNEYGDYWTKNMYGKKYSFRNPLKQNYAHVKALEKQLDVGKSKFIPIVAFSDNCEIKVDTEANVIYFSNLKRVIREYTEIKFQEDELDMLEDKIYSINIIEKEERKEHIKNVKMNVQNRNSKISAGICPRCGGQLVPRSGRYGRFVGCSNYPKCRYTM